MSKNNVRSLLKMIDDSIDDMDDDDVEKLHDGLLSNVEHLIHRIDIINRLKAYYPVGGYVTADRCYSEWKNDILNVHIEGWRHTVISYKYIDGLYYKQHIYSGNVNGRGTPINENYSDCGGLTEGELFLEISMIGD
jgi:hypothetical protein